MGNKYIKFGKFSDEKIRDAIRYFSCDIEASKVSFLTGINRVSVNRVYKAIRTRIAELCEQKSVFPCGEIKMDESDFGARRVRGRGARGKQIVFGLTKRKVKIDTQIVKSFSKNGLHSVIKAHAGEDVTIFADSLNLCRLC